MVKFYKQGKIVVVLNGRFAGRKGVIVKSNYESVKDRKYPHCMVVGLSKGPKKPTKKNIAKLQAKIKKLESSENPGDKVKRLKSFGIFIKTYNMSHLLATRYTLKDDLGIAKSVSKIDELDRKLKEDKIAIENKEKSKKEENAKELEELRTNYGKAKDDFKQEIRNAKINIGTQMYNRFMKGFESKGKSEEEKENQINTQFLFKKLQF